MAEQAAKMVASAYPKLEVHAVVADFEVDVHKVPAGSRRLVALLGSTIGNFPERDSVDLLRRFSELLDDRGWFLLGADLVKDRGVLEA